MRKTVFRGLPLVNREWEEEYFLKRFKRGPERILFIYGPKSSGKTTFMEYMVEEHLKKDKKNFYVSYVNFRGYAIVNYTSFLNVYFKPIYEKARGVWHKFIANLGVIKGEVVIPSDGVNFGVSLNMYDLLNKNEVDPFDLLLKILMKIKSKGRMPILIIDEIQELKDIYMNGDIKNRYLLTEFFRFLIRLTKETHTAHIVIITSSSVFIDEVYNHSKLAKTSDFYLFDHFNRDITEKWLEMEGFKKEEIELVWEYLGGCPFDLAFLISEREIYGDKFDLMEHLTKQALSSRGKIESTLALIEDKKIQKYFEEIMEKIIKKGFVQRDIKDKLQRDVLIIGIDKDILFLNSDTGKIIFNSQLMKKGAEVYLGLEK